MNAFGFQAAFPTELHCLVSGRFWLLITPESPSQTSPSPAMKSSCQLESAVTHPLPALISPLMIQYHAEVVHDWLQLKIYTYFTLHCPIILYECPNIDRTCMICQTHAGAVGCKRHIKIFTFKKNSLMEKADPDLQSYRAVCLISPMGS